MGETPVKKHLPAIPSLSTCVETTPPNCLGTTNQLPSHYLLAIERLQKNVGYVLCFCFHATFIYLNNEKM
jgi:hypothetical protein